MSRVARLFPSPGERSERRGGGRAERAGGGGFLYLLDRRMEHKPVTPPRHSLREWGEGNREAGACPSAALRPRGIIRALARDRHVVDVALAQARAGDAHEARLVAELGEARGADVAHGGAQAAGELMQHGRDRALVGHLTLDALRHELEVVLDVLLEITVGRAARALARSPEFLMPPAAITGVSVARATSTASRIAVSCGMPTPATTRVVQIEPGPMPTLMASAPASMSALAPSPVATLPATTCTAFDRRLIRLTASSTRVEWPCAVSTTTRSTPAAISLSVRAKPGSPTVVAAATRTRPCSSLLACGFATAFSMSLTVIKPTQRY